MKSARLRSVAGLTVNPPRPASSGRARCRRGAATEPRVRVQLYFRAIGVAIDVPVWLPRPVVDLKICMYDRMYQDSVLVHTR